MGLCNLFKCRKRAVAGNHFDDLPPPRVVLLPKSFFEKSSSVLPICAIPVPNFDVSISSSTSLAMFEDIRTTRVRSRLSSLSDLSTPFNFCPVPINVCKAVGANVGKINNEVTYSVATRGSSFDNDIKSDDDSAFDPCSTSTSASLIERIDSAISSASSFGDHHGVESLFEPILDYAPTTPTSPNEYTERAMEYQRVILLFGPGSIEYNNVQREHALAVLEGLKPQRNDPLESGFLIALHDVRC
ncbi:hypothetical protein E4T39_01469 [Aureobasidium subglaciale]|nr:hypothetical protein E4T39_01469 [Aureobasidium subglaciale]